VLLLLAAHVALPRPAAAQDAGPFGTWVGEYSCGQGRTGLTLTVGGADSDHLDAVFDFYPAAGNPELPEGCYVMSGRYDRSKGSLSLSAGRWMLQPPNYVTVDLAGNVSGGSFKGTVRGPSCSTFDLHRTKASPHVPNPACVATAVAQRPAAQETTQPFGFSPAPPRREGSEANH
jgi:hypothetical protein